MTNQDYIYKIVNDEVHLERYIGEEKESITIPKFINEKPVTNLCGYFSEEEQQHIGVFEGFDWLKSVEFQENITYIGDRAFYSCTRLRYESLPHYSWNVRCEKQSFYGCDKIPYIFGNSDDTFVCLI